VAVTASWHRSCRVSRIRFSHHFCRHLLLDGQYAVYARRPSSSTGELIGNHCQAEAKSSCPCPREHEQICAVEFSTKEAPGRILPVRLPKTDADTSPRQLMPSSSARCVPFPVAFWATVGTSKVETMEMFVRPREPANSERGVIRYGEIGRTGPGCQWSS